MRLPKGVALLLRPMLRRLLVVATLLFILFALPELANIILSDIPPRTSHAVGAGTYAAGRPGETITFWQEAPRKPSLNLVVLSPPPGIGVPLGQYIGVCYYFEGEAPAVLEFMADGEEVAQELVQPGQKMTHAWTPTQAGPHQIRVRVLSPDGTVQAGSSLNVIGLADSERVRVPRFSFRFELPWFLW